MNQHQFTTQKARRKAQKKKGRHPSVDGLVQISFLDMFADAAGAADETTTLFFFPPEKEEEEALNNDDEPIVVTLPTPLRRFRITSEHKVGTGGLHEKATANIAAIRLLKTLEAEGREALTEGEEAILVRYSGWGALPQLFETEWRIRPEWKILAAELKEVLTEEEYESARATTPNAHFTSTRVIRAIWQALERMGVAGNVEVLEPAMGIGHFFGCLPDTLERGHQTGVELDQITARIARQLYPDATIFVQGFEETHLPDSYFDVVVGNVPFGDYGVHDPGVKKSLTRAIHDYFFAKSLQKVRPGGILALITSHYTMDKVDTSVREYLGEHADLVAAVRLPNTAFKENAGTEVTTDILFLQRREEGAEQSEELWQYAVEVTIEGKQTRINQYFVAHPEMVMGTLTMDGTMYGGHELTVEGELTDEALEHIVSLLPRGIYQPRIQSKRVAAIAKKEKDAPRVLSLDGREGIKDGGFGVVDGEIVRREGEVLETVHFSAMDGLRVRGLIQIRDMVARVFQTQLENEPETAIDTARFCLNAGYDEFVQRFGPINAPENVRAFAGDPDQPLLLSLERYESATKSAKKGVIFERRTLAHYTPVSTAETPEEALAISLNENGFISWERMSGLTGRSAEELQMALSGQVFLTPQGTWETADQYLSGNVRIKLKDAEAAYAMNPGLYSKNVEALKACQPVDIPPGQISVRLGAPWIPKEDIETWIAELLDTHTGEVHLFHTGLIATWVLKLGYFTAHSVANTTTYGTKRISANELIEAALNMRMPTIYDTLPDDSRVINQGETIAAREAQQKLKDHFTQWIWQDTERVERLARLYNDTFNNLRLRTYDGSHLSFPGMSRELLRNNDLDPHQKNAVWRILQQKNVLLGHVVGSGKTYSMAAACMELKRMGLAKKPIIVVPNHLVDQWGMAFLTLYPQANIFVAGKDHFAAGKREKAMARIATGTYDAVIVSHRSFESLPVSDRTFHRFLNTQITALEDAILESKSDRRGGGDNRSIIKSLEKAKKRLEVKIKERAQRKKKDDGVTFEELGIDRIFVDEADLYKNLGFVTKMNRIAGLPNTESNRALDMFMKTRYVYEHGGGIVFATGTPISNTIAEMYTLMRYLAPEELERAGVAHFDAWAANFGEAVTALELSPDGRGYRMHTRFSKFVNLPELLAMFHTFADIQTKEMQHLPSPELAGGKPRVVAAAPTPQLRAYVDKLVKRAERIRGGGVDPRDDNMLRIVTAGRKAALDMRLVEAGSDPFGDTKVSKAVEMIYQIWYGNRTRNATQVVFCDLSAPQKGFNVYDDIRLRLEARGVPASEIRFIHQADTDARKKALFDAVNEGRVRILLGSTEKMGAGTNVQRLLIALHHLDPPWRPRDIEQREGRILRQGNENPCVAIYRYVTQESFDAYMWQTLETKARFIGQVMSGQVTVREAEDLDGGTLSFAEIKAIASGNPLVMDKVRIDTEVRKLDMLRSNHRSQQVDIGRHIRYLPDRIAAEKERLADLLADVALRDERKTKEFAITIGNRLFTGEDARKNAAEALQKTITGMLWELKQERGERVAHEVGKLNGFRIVVIRDPLGGDFPSVFLKGDTLLYDVNVNLSSPIGTIYSMESTLRNIEGRVDQLKLEIERREKELVDYQGQLGIPFDQEERFQELLQKQQEINKQLDLDKSENQVAEEKSEGESGSGGSEPIQGQEGDAPEGEEELAEAVA